jgi:hypothetical protein
VLGLADFAGLVIDQSRPCVDQLCIRKSTLSIGVLRLDALSPVFLLLP